MSASVAVPVASFRKAEALIRLFGARVRRERGAAMAKRIIAVAVVAVALALAAVAVAQGEVALTPMEELGKMLFFDTSLSINSNQSCAACHAPEVGWTGPDEYINAHGTVYEGSIPGAFGDRKPPSSAYGGGSPILYMDKKGVWVGGMFWDGRATGWTLGDPLAEQAKGPFLNPMEQAITDAATLVAKVQASSYVGLFEEVWGTGIWTDTTAAYDAIGYSIAAYERSAEVNPYSSKFDAWRRGKAKLTLEELNGWALFNGKGKCSKCHISHPSGTTPPVFTDFTYDNLGAPKNPENPATIADPLWADPGLGGFLRSAGYSAAVYEAAWGKFKVPTLRNVDLRPYPEFVKAYGHNGYFKSLEQIVHFYNTRDVTGEGWNGVPWPAPEVAANMNTTELGNLGLTADEEAAIVAFMKTLSDGYVAP